LGAVVTGAAVGFTVGRGVGAAVGTFFWALVVGTTAKRRAANNRNERIVCLFFNVFLAKLLIGEDNLVGRKL